MSKSKGNVIDPWTVLDTRGADALRWNFFSAGSPWTPRRVSVEAIDESTRASSSRSGTPTRSSSPTRTSTAGRPVPSTSPRVDARARPVGPLAPARTRSPRSPTRSRASTRCAARRRSRRSSTTSRTGTCAGHARASGRPTDPSAHATLHECLTTIALLLAPFTPFVADELYRNLRGTTESVHLADWPVADADALDDALEAEMERARAVVSARPVGPQRGEAQGAPAAPRALVLLPDGGAFSDEVAAEVADALNVKAARDRHRPRGPPRLHGGPELQAARPRVRSQMPLVKDALLAADGGTVQRALDADGALRPRPRRRHDRAARPRRRRGARRVARRARARAGGRLRGRARHHRRRRAARRGHRPRARPPAQRPAQGRRASRSPTASGCGSAPRDASRRPRTRTATGSPARCSRSTFDVLPLADAPRRRATPRVEVDGERRSR